MFRRDIKVQFNDVKYGRVASKGVYRTMRGFAPTAMKSLIMLAFSALFGLSIIRRWRYNGVIILCLLFAQVFEHSRPPGFPNFLTETELHPTDPVPFVNSSLAEICRNTEISTQ